VDEEEKFALAMYVQRYRLLLRNSEKLVHEEASMKN
jgi:hypothetical protein